MEQEILTVSVSQVNHYIKRVLENNGYLKQICIKGEISNFKRHPSGHLYLTLKDEASVLRAVMFRSDAMGLRFAPEDGIKVAARGRVSVYEPGGNYQLYIEAMEPDGEGALYAAFEKLKKKLEEEGLFDAAFKKPLPPFPETICVITASSGAAVRDILNILQRRYPLCSVRVLPVAVQGASAAPEIAKAIRLANEKNLGDIIIAGRGGGSIEDLWAFNDERVAYAIYESKIPVISAVGHETDFTIADFVADKRAPTPSAAAEIAVPDAKDTKRQLLNVSKRLESILNMNIKDKRVRVKELASSRAMTVPRSAIDEKRLALTALDNRMCRTADGILHRAGVKKNTLGAKLESLIPLAILARGYGAAFDKDGKVIKSISQINSGEVFTLRLSDGEMEAIKK